MSVKILCLGNEFIKEDSFAKKIMLLLKKRGFNVIDIKDSFQLMNEIEEDCFIIDVVKGISEIKIINSDMLKSNSIISAHDFDAGFVLKLLGKKTKIIGIPFDFNGNVRDVVRDVKFFIQKNQNL